MKKSSENMDIALALRTRRELQDPAEISLESEGPPPVAAPPGKPVGVREVAHVAKVSVATVSLVINDNPRISQATQQRVRKVMEQLGYRPNRLAQNLSRRDTRVLAVMMPSLSHSFADRYFGELISGISDRAVKLGYKLLIEQATPEFIRERRHIDLFDRRFVDGVLCLGNSDKHPFLTDFLAGKFPTIVVNNYFPQWPDLDYVVADYRGGAEQAMNYLIQLGHRKIGMIMGSTRVQTARDVVDVYEKKLAEIGAEADPRWRQDGAFTEIGGAGAVDALIREAPELTAILCGNDKMAIGALQYLDQAGIRVPQDISIVGFDDIQHAAFVKPPLTTVHLPLYEAGVLACEKLINRIHGQREQVQAVLPTHLVVRNSTGIVKETATS